MSKRLRVGKYVAIFGASTLRGDKLLVEVVLRIPWRQDESFCVAFLETRISTRSIAGLALSDSWGHPVTKRFSVKPEGQRRKLEHVLFLREPGGARGGQKDRGREIPFTPWFGSNVTRKGNPFVIKAYIHEGNIKVRYELDLLNALNQDTLGWVRPTESCGSMQLQTLWGLPIEPVWVGEDGGPVSWVQRKSFDGSMSCGEGRFELGSTAELHRRTGSADLDIEFSAPRLYLDFLPWQPIGENLFGPILALSSVLQDKSAKARCLALWSLDQSLYTELIRRYIDPGIDWCHPGLQTFLRLARRDVPLNVTALEFGGTCLLARLEEI